MLLSVQACAVHAAGSRVHQNFPKVLTALVIMGRQLAMIRQSQKGCGREPGSMSRVRSKLSTTRFEEKYMAHLTPLVVTRDRSEGPKAVAVSPQISLSVQSRQLKTRSPTSQLCVISIASIRTGLVARHFI